MAHPSAVVDMRVEDFLSFLENRPRARARRELVGGMPIMTAPPLVAHQRIASNAERRASVRSRRSP